MRRIVLILVFFCFLVPGFSAEEKFPTLDHKGIYYTKLISSKNSVLFIWATWCPSCRRELEELSRERVFFENVDFWYVNTGEDAATVKSYVEAKRLSDSIRDRIVLDQQGYIAGKFSVISIPTYIFFKDREPVFRSYFLNQEVIEKVFGKE